MLGGLVGLVLGGPSGVIIGGLLGAFIGNSLEEITKSVQYKIMNFESKGIPYYIHVDKQLIEKT